MRRYFSILIESIKRGCLDIISHPMYLGCMILAPLLGALFFVTLLDRGVADQVPSAVVDLDHTPTSRQIVKTLDSFKGVDVKCKLNSYTEAMDLLKRGEIMGFVLIPEDFSSKALAGRQPELSYYINYSYFASASLMVKDYTTVSALSNASVLSGVMTSVGIDEHSIKSTLQPFTAQVHALGNPWIDYGVYMSNSFAPALLALMVMVMTAYSIGLEIKNGTSVEWLKRADGSIQLAVLGKLLPQAVVFTIVGWAMQIGFYGIAGYPLACPFWHMALAMMLLVIGTQAFALTLVSLVPHMRLSLSVCCLIGILTFSLAGLSFPVEQMYPWIGVLSKILPMRYYFLIYSHQALNGCEFAYSAADYAALLAFTLAPLMVMWNLKKHCQKPIYIS